MERVIQLSMVKLNTSPLEVVKFLKNEGKPIFFSVPADKNVWKIIIGVDLNVIAESMINEGIHRLFPDVDIPRPGKKTSIIEAQLIDQNCYGRLEDQDLIILINQHYIHKRVSKSIYTFNPNGELKPVCCDKPSKSTGSRSIRKRFPKLLRTEFIYTDRAIDSWAFDGSTYNETVGIDISAESLVVFRSDIMNFLLSDLNSIPGDSPYFIPSHLRDLSDLDKLAVIGHLCLIKGNDAADSMSSGVLAKAVRNKLKYADRKAQSAAFYLNLKPSGRKGDPNKVPMNEAYPHCQFPFLIRALELRLNLGADVNNTYCSAVEDFLDECGFSEENKRYGELMVRPTLSNSNQ